MKNILILTFIIMNTLLFGQNNMNEPLKKLFSDLDLSQSPKEMVKQSKLQFEYGSNRTINWGNSANNTSEYVASFDKNSFIESKIKKGVITIIPKSSDTKNNIFSINQRIWFYSSEDMLKDFAKTCSIFEKLASKIKNTTVQNENFETISENVEFTIDPNNKLTIGYYLSPINETDKEYSLAFIYE